MHFLKEHSKPVAGNFFLKSDRARAADTCRRVFVAPFDLRLKFRYLLSTESEKSENGFKSSVRSSSISLVSNGSITLVLGLVFGPKSLSLRKIRSTADAEVGAEESLRKQTSVFSLFRIKHNLRILFEALYATLMVIECKIRSSVQCLQCLQCLHSFHRNSLSPLSLGSRLNFNFNEMNVRVGYFELLNQYYLSDNLILYSENLKKIETALVEAMAPTVVEICSDAFGNGIYGKIKSLSEAYELYELHYANVQNFF